MRAMRWLAAIMMVATLAGCAALESPVTKGQRLVGSDQSAVQAQFGPPRESYPLDGGTRWLYPTQPYGQFTYAADFDASGKLVAIGRDSNVAEDQPKPLNGLDTDDLSRGTAGKLDPFIGPGHCLSSKDHQRKNSIQMTQKSVPPCITHTYQMSCLTWPQPTIGVDSATRSAESRSGFSPANGCAYLATRKLSRVKDLRPGEMCQTLTLWTRFVL